MTTLLLAASLAFPSPMYLDRGKHSPVGVDVDTQTLFDAPLNTNGLTAANPSTTWPVTGVAAPDVAWWADDPTGSGGKTTHAFTATGAPSSVDTPFCPDGSHSDLTSGCLTARRFNGANQYYTSDVNGVGAFNSADATVCVLYRSETTGDYIVANREDSGGEGWGVLTGAARVTWYVENHAASQSAIVFNTFDPLGLNWVFTCATHDADGNIVPYGNARTDTAGASPGGVVDSAEPLSIGAENGGAFDFVGDIVFAFVWNSLLDATDMAELFEYFVGINDNKSAPVAYTSTGPNCMFVDGAIECYGDDWPIIGAELPPGVTGAGSPSSGYYSGQALTNSITYSRELDNGCPGACSWSMSGTPEPTATSTDLFRDGRQTYRITDDDVGAREGVSQPFVAHGLSNGDDVQVCVYAKDSTGTSFDFRAYEYAGACGGGATTYNYDAVTITTSWAQYEWTHTITDDTCTALVVYFAPDWNNNATVGSVEFAVQIFFDQDWCPPIYIETAAAAVGAGDDFLMYDVSGSGMFTADGSLDVGSLAIEYDYTLSLDFGSNGWGFEIEDGATATDYWYTRHYGSGTQRLYGRSVEDASRILFIDAVETVTPGTTYTWTITPQLTFADCSWKKDGVELTNTGSANLASGPNSLDNMSVGCSGTGTAQTNSWVDTVKVTK